MSNGSENCNTCNYYEEQIDNLQSQISNLEQDIEQYQSANQTAPGSISQQQIAGVQARIDRLYRECSDAVENYNRHHRSAHGKEAPAKPMPSR